MLVLVRPAWSPTRVARETCAVGFGGLGNKGAVALRMQIRTASLCLITVHLPAGSSAEAGVAREMALAECMMSLGVKLQHAGAMAPLAHDLCVVLGDFNSRVGVPREVAERAIDARDDLAILLATDELTRRGLAPFTEAPIAFAPTCMIAPRPNSKTPGTTKPPSLLRLLRSLRLLVSRDDARHCAHRQVRRGHFDLRQLCEAAHAIVDGPRAVEGRRAGV